MTLVARELLTLIKSVVAEFEQQGQTSTPASTLQAQHVAIVCMMRSVGHVLEKTDCSGDPALQQFLKGRWAIWKQDTIFAKFIEPARNDLLKEFKGRLQLQGDEVHQVFYANPNSPDNATTAVLFEPGSLRDVHGRQVLPLFKAAIMFWDARLKEVESFQSGVKSRE